MTSSPEAIATAFSGHRFAEAYPALHEDLRWTLVGSSVPDEATAFEVMGQQWQWSFRLPGKDGRLGAADTRNVSPDNPRATVGSSVLVGKAAAVEACESTLAGLAETTTTFRRFDTVVGQDAVVVDSVAEYSSDDGSVTVASCDLYQFRDGQVVAIRSYTVEVAGGEQD